MALGIRQLSMTIIIPFLTTYSKTLIGSTPILAGLTIGIFGLMQAIFQVPFGMLSDKYGNKKIMIVGLLLVIGGLLLSAFAKNIYTFILARAIQGSGAIIGVGYSWSSSIYNKNDQDIPMSILGSFISMSAAVAFLLGPILILFVNIKEIFLICSTILIVNLIFIGYFINDNYSKGDSEIFKIIEVKKLIKNKKIVLFNSIAFIMNFIMISIFYSIPLTIETTIGQNKMWEILLPTIIFSIFILKFAINKKEKYQDLIFKFALGLVMVSTIVLSMNNSFKYLFIGMALFFSGYLVSLTFMAIEINQFTDNTIKGTVNGIYNSFQYIGNFIGAIFSGLFFVKNPDYFWIVLIIISTISLMLSFKIYKKGKRER
ncbi:hypothetical protein NC01_07790 [Streptococcus uberis]|nr:hypothetical protein NC01_07790 [Streptococcus uberis]